MLSLTVTSEDDKLYSVEVEETATVAGLKQVVEFHSGVPQTQQQLWHNNQLLQDSTTLSSSGVSQHDLVLLRKDEDGRQPGSANLPAGFDALIQSLRRDPGNPFWARLPASIRDGVLRQDSSSVRQLVEFMQAQQAQQVAARQAEIDALNENEFDPEAQARIAEQIRQQNVEANYEAAYEHSPEVFGEIIMLYVNLQVNSVPLKAFVDSGAQSCVMSLACAERCNIAHLIDKRFQGIVQGVGTQKMTGRIHSVSVKVGSQLVPMAVTVIEKLDIDFLFGLDMLRRYRCSIDLEHNCLRFGTLENTSLDFLPEHEVPNRKQPQQLLNPSGPSSSTGPGPAAAAAGAAAAARAAASSVGPAAGGASASARTAPIAGAAPARQPSQLGAQVADRTTPELEAKVAQLQGLGFAREQCIQALNAVDGDADQAAALLFGG